VVITNDSDLREPTEIAQAEFGIRVGVINLQKAAHRSRALMNVTFFKQLRLGALRRSQFPDVLQDQQGLIHKPGSWKYPETQRPAEAGLAPSRRSGCGDTP
jgi:hypothetical protein